MRRSLFHRWAVLIALGALAAGGCGGGGSPESAGPGNGGDIMPAVELEHVVRAQRRISFCRGDRGTRGMRQATATLVAVYRDGPDWIYQWAGSTEMGRPMREVLADARPRVAACGDPVAVARIDRALAEDRGG